ncbi:MAG: efflux RND transporter periplasmic adaptor subunit [Methylotenera sp.]|nr:efflux RND transporter periplasmic adaptor subunit [Oligoflexia bacterium]
MTKSMASLVLLFSAGGISLLSNAPFVHFFVSPQPAHADDTGDGKSPLQNGKYYTCPMHPEVRSKGPGECPICHMKLHLVESNAPKAAEAPAKNTVKDPKIKFYRNPMNPAMTSKVPMKDTMGMDYLPVYDDETATVTPSKVEGRGVLHLDSEQFGLSGSSLVQVGMKKLTTRLQISGRILSSSRVSIQIPERDLGFVKAGLAVELESPMAPGQKLTGKIVSLDSILDPMTRSLRADVQLKASVSTFRSEGSVSGSVLLEKPAALMVPESSVIYLASGPYVFVADSKKGRLIPTPVKLGLRGTNEIEVILGLKAGDLISSGPNFLLDSESRIRAAHD